jgi:hypothetical protein
MSCQICGSDKTTVFAEFSGNIGALIMRFERSIRGYMCRICVGQQFWKFTAMNFFSDGGELSRSLSRRFILSSTPSFTSNVSAVSGGTKPVLSSHRHHPFDQGFTARTLRPKVATPQCHLVLPYTIHAFLQFLRHIREIPAASCPGPGLRKGIVTGLTSALIEAESGCATAT